MKPAALEFSGVAIAFGPTPVLDGVDLRVEAGEAVALVGRSGSGKTTLLQLAAGLAVPDRGEIRVAGQPMSVADPDERARLRRRSLGYIFQAYNLIPTLTVAENLEFPLALLGERPDRQALEAQLASLGLSGYGERYPDTLSGGEQQRVAILRALIHQPTVVLADEPTANLDLDNARQVIEMLLATCRERHAALLLVTHSSDLSVTLDRVLRISDRKLVTQA